MPTSFPSLEGDGDAGNLVFLHDFEGVGNFGIGRHGDGIDDHAALGPLHLVDFIGLLLDVQVAMDDAEASLLRHGDGHVRLGNRIHGGADDGNVQPDVARKLGLGIGVGGHDSGMGREQQYVVKCEGFGYWEVNHNFWMKLLL
jgi:hypothetical protein